MLSDATTKNTIYSDSSAFSQQQMNLLNMSQSLRSQSIEADHNNNNESTRKKLINLLIDIKQSTDEQIKQLIELNKKIATVVESILEPKRPTIQTNEKSMNHQKIKRHESDEEQNQNIIENTKNFGIRKQEKNSQNISEQRQRQANYSPRNKEHLFLSKNKDVDSKIMEVINQKKFKQRRLRQQLRRQNRKNKQLFWQEEEDNEIKQNETSKVQNDQLYQLNLPESTGSDQIQSKEQNSFSTIKDKLNSKIILSHQDMQISNQQYFESKKIINEIYSTTPFECYKFDQD